MKKYLCLVVVVTAVLNIVAVPNPQKYLRVMPVRQGLAINGSKNVMVPAVHIAPEQQEKIVQGIAQARAAEQQSIARAMQVATLKQKDEALDHLKKLYSAYLERLELHRKAKPGDNSELIKGETAAQDINNTIVCCKNMVLNPDGRCNLHYLNYLDDDHSYSYIDLKTNFGQRNGMDNWHKERFNLFLEDAVSCCPKCMPKVLELYALSKK